MKRKNKYKHSTIDNMKFIDSESLYKKFVNHDSRLMKIYNKIDFSFVNDLCDGIYSDDGQNAYSPELVFRVCFIKFFAGGLSDNEIIRQCKVNMEYRYFCNLSVDDDLFDDCKLSRFRKELGPKKFKEIFDMIVEKIKDADLIDEEDVQYMDSNLFIADVKLVSINALISKALQNVLKALDKIDPEIAEDAKKRDFEMSEDEQKNRFVFLVQKAQKIISETKKRDDLTKEVLSHIEVLRKIVKERAEINDNQIRKKENKEEKDKTISASDPDARMMGKKKTPILPCFKSHIAMNKNNYITYTDVTRSTIYDGHQAYEIIKDLKKRHFNVPVAVGDTHYGDIDFRTKMANENTQIVAPYRQNQAWNSCLTEDAMIEAWAFNHTAEYKKHMKKRAQIEPKQGEMKNLHGLKRALFRGLQNVRIQNFMSAIVTNCKRFAAS